MDESHKQEFIEVIISYAVIAIIFLIASHIEYLFNN